MQAQAAVETFAPAIHVFNIPVKVKTQYKPKRLLRPFQFQQH